MRAFAAAWPEREMLQSDIAASGYSTSAVVAVPKGLAFVADRLQELQIFASDATICPWRY